MPDDKDPVTLKLRLPISVLRKIEEASKGKVRAVDESASSDDTVLSFLELGPRQLEAMANAKKEIDALEVGDMESVEAIVAQMLSTFEVGMLN